MLLEHYQFVYISLVCDGAFYLYLSKAIKVCQWPLSCCAMYKTLKKNLKKTPWFLQAIRVFFMLRDLSLTLRQEAETQLPLTKQEECVNVQDVLDLSMY